MAELGFLPKLLLQHDASPDHVLEDVQGAFLAAAGKRAVLACLSPSGDGLAVALGQRLVVLRGLGTASQYGGAAAVEFVTALDAPEAATALCWLAAGGQSTDECLLLGTSAGFLQLHAPASGAALLRQRLHHTPCVAAAVRWGGCGSDPEDLSEDVTLTFESALVRLPAWEVWAAVRWASGRGGGAGGAGAGHWWGGSGAGGGGGGAPPHQLGFSKFVLPKGTGPRSAALCLGPPPPDLYAALAGRGDAPHRLRMLTAGASPPLASFEGEEANSQGLVSLVADLASTTAASLLGRAAAYVPRPRSLLGGLGRRGGGGSSGSVASASAAGSASSSAADLAAWGQQGAQQGQQAAQQARGRRAEKIPGEPASLEAAVWDEKRSVAQMVLSPCGRWAACCDSLGRILLADACSTLILRMLKGYRDAQVAWLVCGDGDDGLAAAGSGGSGWAARFGSTSSLGSLGGSSALGSLRGSAADLAALPQQAAQQQGEGPATSAAASPERGGAPAASPDRQQAAAAPAGRAAEQEGAQPPPQRRGRGALLVTHAPRRGLIELWEPHTLSRLGSLQCGTQPALLLQQPARRRAGGAAGGAAAAPAPNRVLLLDAATLMLTDLTPTLNSLAV